MRLKVNCLARATLALMLAGAPGAALAEGIFHAGWGGCRSADPQRRVEGCSVVIAHLRSEPAHNKLTAYFNRGEAYLALGQYDKAVGDLSQALEFAPKSAQTLIARAAAYKAKGDLDKAMADYDAALAASSKNAQASLGRGAIYYGKADYDKAIADFSQSIQFDPKQAAAYEARASAYRAKGELDKALPDLHRGGRQRQARRLGADRARHLLPVARRSRSRHRRFSGRDRAGAEIRHRAQRSRPRLARQGRPRQSDRAV